MIALMLAAAASAGEADSGKACKTLRIREDGSMIEVKAGKGSARGEARASGSRSVSVSVSASSSSSGRSSSSSSTTVDGKGRRVTTIHDDKGCTVTIDERG